MTQARDAIETLTALKADSSLWTQHYQRIGEVIHGMKQNFNDTNPRGAELNDMYSSDGAFALRSASSAVLGLLWPEGGKTIVLQKPRELKLTRENKTYYDKFTEIVQEALDDENAGLGAALDEYMQDQLSFGTAGVGVFEADDDEPNDVRFEAWSVMSTWVDEEKGPFIDIEYRVYDWSVKKIVNKYKPENVGEAILKKMKTAAGRLERRKVLVAVQRRAKRNAAMKGSKNMPWQALHIDIDSQKILRDDGFGSNPVLMARLRKLSYEVRGRSPAMDALGAVLEQDFLKERFSVNVDKAGDPPLMVTGGGFNNDTIDTSARGVNVFNPQGRINNNIDPVRPLFAVGELNTTLERIRQLAEEIAQHFMIDRLIDLNNDVQMTKGEAVIRDRRSMNALTMLLSRQESELFTRMVARTVDILMSKGRLGVLEGSDQHNEALARGEDPLVIPNDVAKLMLEGKVFYKVKYLSPAARLMRAAQAENIQLFSNFVDQRAAINPRVSNRLDDDKAIKLMGEALSVPGEIVRSDEEFDERDALTQENEKLRGELEAAQAGASALKDAGAGARDLAEAGAVNNGE